MSFFFFGFGEPKFEVFTSVSAPASMPGSQDECILSLQSGVAMLIATRKNSLEKDQSNLLSTLEECSRSSQILQFFSPLLFPPKLPPHSQLGWRCWRFGGIGENPSEAGYQRGLSNQLDGGTYRRHRVWWSQKTQFSPCWRGVACDHGGT